MSVRALSNIAASRFRLVATSAALLALAGCASGPRSGPLEQTLDPTDYAANRQTVAQFYGANPAAYWGQFGLPAIARTDMLVTPDPSRGDDAFAALEATFDRDGFRRAQQTGELPARFETLYSNAQGDGLETWPAITRAIGTLVLELDAQRLEQNIPHEETAAAAVLSAVFSVAFPGAVEMFAPSTPDKPPSTPLEPPLDPVCQAGSNAFEPLVSSRPPGTQDSDTSSTRNWTDITNVLWDTTYNASCVAQAAGPCAAKLGIRGDGVSGNSMTCKDWNDLSKALGAEARGKGGSNMSSVNGWFRSKGYCSSIAYDGAFESACDEARKALARGCDVMLHYSDPDTGNAHIEMVRNLTVKTTDRRQCTVRTWAWGQRESVKYNRGRYSDKSDGRRYRSATESKSYLEGSGNAKFYYYCRC